MNNRNCYKHIGIIFSFTLLIFFCNGCENIKQLKTVSYTWPKDDSVSYSLGSIASSSEQMVYVQDDILHIKDLTTDHDAVLCSRPDCSHQPGYSEDDDTSCEAAAPAEAFGSGFNAVGLHGDVVFEVVSSEDGQNMIYLSKIGENKRTKVAELSYSFIGGHILFSGNTMYASVMVPETEEEEGGDTVSTSGSKAAIISMDLTNYKIKELAEYDSKYGASVRRLDLCDGKLVYEVEGLNSLSDGTSFSDMYALSLKSGKAVRIEQEIREEKGKKKRIKSYIGCYEGTLYFYDEEKHEIVAKEVEEKAETQLVYPLNDDRSFCAAELSVDGKLLYTLNDNKSEDYEKCQVNNYVYDIKEQKLYEASERKSKDYNAMMIWCDKLIAYDAKDASIVDIPLSEYVTEVKK